MFTSTERVKELTDYDVDADLVVRAQAIIEAYVGRVEVEVVDATDLEILEKATVYQAAYMLNDPVRVFEQMAVAQVSQFGATVAFRPDEPAPWVSPLSVLACNRLSWKRMRSVKTGSIYKSYPESVRSWFTT